MAPVERRPRGRPALTYRGNRRNALRRGEPAPASHPWQQPAYRTRESSGSRPVGGWAYQRLTPEQRRARDETRALRLTVAANRLKDYAMKLVADVFGLGAGRPRARSRGG